MTNSLINVIDFDSVKNKYIQGLNLKDTPKSNDALLIESDSLTFIEFKDGYMKKEIYNVRRKIFESLLLLLDILGETIKFSRKNINYILVYNESTNTKYINDVIKKGKENLKEDEISPSSSFNQLSGTIGVLANYKMDVFGLKKQFEKIYFKNVSTFNQEEFEKYLSELKIMQIA